MNPAARRGPPPVASAAFFERYPDERSAETYFADLRWPDGPRCPECSSGDVYDSRSKRQHTNWKCRACGTTFTVMSGTVMESTKLPLRKWLFAYHLMGGARHGLSSRYLARQLGITLKSAWHLTHRIRKTMTKNSQHFSHGIVEAAIRSMVGKRVTLFKTKSGEGDALIDSKQGERRKHGTMRGMSKHVRTGKRGRQAGIVNNNRFAP